MAKYVSKENFIEKLKFYLSFHFDEDENTIIIEDYDEWFENESLQGKSVEEICAALEEPKRIVQNLLSESRSNSNHISILLHNTVIQVLSLIIIQFFSSLLLFRICDRNTRSFFYFALGINFLYFAAGSFIIKKSDRKANHKKSFLSIFCLAVLILLLELILPRVNVPCGHICARVLGTFSLILFAVNLYFTMQSTIRDKLLAFLTTFHISGIITLIFYFINQLHMLYNDRSEIYYYMVYRSFLIYFEIIILYMIFYKRKIKSGE